MANKYMGTAALAALIGKIRSAIADAAAKIKAEGVGQAYPGSTGGEIFNDYQENKASGNNSHAEGSWTEATKSSAHAEGIRCIASGGCAHAEGLYTTASGEASHAEGGTNGTASGMYAHAEGEHGTASGRSSHVEGDECKAEGDHSHAEGEYTTASGKYSHAEGYHTSAAGAGSHAEGYYASANGNYSHAGGNYTIAHDYQTVIGAYNVEKETGTDGYLIVGAGTSWSDHDRKNVFRVSSEAVYGAGTYNSEGADYAELFEFCDGNPDGEDRVGRFVTLDGMKIRLSASGDEPLGILSGTAAILGDVYDDQWHSMEQRDVYGRLIMQMQTVPAVTDDDGSEIVPAHEALLPVRNPEYDNTQEYIPRTQRPEWAAVGMLGKLVALDDGTCEAGGYCQPSDGGVATRAAGKTRYYVMERIDPTHIRVLVRP